MKPTGLSNVIELDRAREGAARPAQVLTSPPAVEARPLRKIIAIGGGKGGIGKTMVSANTAIALALRGFKTVVIDVDLGGANLHTALGITQPKHTLSDLGNPNAELKDILLPTGIPNLSMAAGAQDVLDAANPKAQQKNRLLRNIASLNADYVLLDLGAGTSFNMLDFFLLADHRVLVLLPEPTSVENAYRFAKAAFFRRLQTFGEQHGITELIASMSAKIGATKTPRELVQLLAQQDKLRAHELDKEIRAFRIRLIVNQARTPADFDVGTAVGAAWKKFFGLEMDYLGAVGYDDEAWRAVRKRRPVLLERPNCDAATGLKGVAEKLLSMDGRLEPQAK